MSKQHREATSAVHHPAKPSACDGEACPNGRHSARRDAREGTEQAWRHTSRAICRGYQYDALGVRSAKASPRRLRMMLNPHRDHRTA